MIIRTKDSARTIAGVLASVRAQTIATEIIVVDSGSTDQTLAIAREEADHVFELASGTFTFGRALNAGAAIAGAPVHFALSSHALPPDAGWVERSLAQYARPDVAGTSGAPTSPGSHLPLTSTVHQKLPGALAYPWWGFSNTGSSWRAEVWSEFPFDEELAACEDKEWAFRVMSAGWTIAVDPSLCVSAEHREDQGAAQLYRRTRREFEALATFAAIPTPGRSDLLRRWLRDLPDTGRYRRLRRRLSPLRFADLLGRHHGLRTAPASPGGRLNRPAIAHAELTGPATARQLSAPQAEQGPGRHDAVPDPQEDAAQAISSYSTGLAFSLASFVAIGFLSLFTSVLSARLYGITVIGQSALALAPVLLVTLLSTVREQPAMVRELAKLSPRHPRVTGVCTAVFAFSFTLTAAVSLVGAIASYFIFHGPLHNPGLVAPADVALLGYVVLINTCWNIDSAFAAFRAGRELFAVRLNQMVAYGLLLVGFTFITHSVWGLVLAYLGSWLSALVHRLLLLRRVMRWCVPLQELRAGFRTLREIVTFGIKVTPGTIAAGFSEISGTWIVGLTSSVNLVGAYSRAWNISSRLNELNWRITEMLLPTLVERRSNQDIEGFNRVIVDSLRYAGFGLLLPAAVCGGAAEPIMHLFGAGFGSATTALEWLLFVPLLQTLTAIQGTAMMSLNQPLLTSIVQATRMLVTLSLGVGLTLLFGITGMAIAMTCGSLVSVGIYLIVLAPRLGGTMSAFLGFRQLAGLAAAYVGAFGFSHLMARELGGGLGLIAVLMSGSLVYVAFALGVGGTTEQDRARLRSALGRLPRPRALSTQAPGQT